METVVARTPEGAVKAKVVAVLKDEDVYYFFPATHGYGRSGVPDIICCVNGLFVAIECKAGKGVPTALQLKNIDQIHDAGGVAFVVNETNVDQLAAVLESMK